MNKKLAAAATAAVLVVGGVLVNAQSASALYQDLYNKSCSSGKDVGVNSSTKGNTQHYKNGSLWAYWYGNATAAYHYSNLLTSSVSNASVETAGANQAIISAYYSCD